MLLSLKAFGVRGRIAGVNSYINQAAETLSGKTLVLDSRSDVILEDAAFTETPPYVSLNPAQICLHWHPSTPSGADAALGIFDSHLARSQNTIH